MRSFVCILLLCLIISSRAFAEGGGGFHFMFGVGADIPDETELSRVNSAGLMQFRLTTLGTIRFSTSFTMAGSSGYQQGELGIGFRFFFLTDRAMRKSPFHPFLFGEGIAGIGSLDDVSRKDFGYSVAAGVDLKFWKKSGISLILQQQNTTEQSLRGIIGIFNFQ